MDAAPLGRLVTCAVAAMLLAACQAPQGRIAQDESKNTEAARDQIAALPQTPAQERSTPEKPVSAIAIPAVARDGVAVGPIVHLTGDPKQLVGLDNATVRRALGDPIRIRSDEPAEVWQYATGECIVDLYLYRLDGGLRVTFVEARSHTAEAEPTARCLKSLLERPTAQADS